MKFRKKLVLSVFAAAAVVGLIGIGYAAFMDKSEILGTSVSVGSADIKLLDDVAGGVGAANLVDTKSGPSFENIGQVWSDDYLVKLYNNAPGTLLLSSYANYETANDPSDLRQDIYIEPIEWDDVNSDGVASADELGTSYGVKTIVKWKTEGFDLGTIDTGGIKGLVLRFSTTGLADSKQGATAIFDFEFQATEM